MAHASRRPLSPLAVAAAGLALLVAIVGAMAGFGSRLGLWDFRFGFKLLGWATWGALGVAILSVVAALLTRPGGPRRGFALAFLGLVVSMVVFAIPFQWRSTAKGMPPIHDISTDVQNPPQFQAVVPLRRDAANPLEYGGEEVARQQREAFPDIQPLLLQMPKERAFQRALDAARKMGWEIVSTDPVAGRIEATAHTFWFGFKDDVVVRLTPANDRTVLDVRSVSRVGKGDVGTNARRVRAYLKRVREG